MEARTETGRTYRLLQPGRRQFRTLLPTASQVRLPASTGTASAACGYDGEMYSISAGGRLWGGRCAHRATGLLPPQSRGLLGADMEHRRTYSFTVPSPTDRGA